MTKKLFLFAALFAATTIGFQSCSDDDKEDNHGTTPNNGSNSGSGDNGGNSTTPVLPVANFSFAENGNFAPSGFSFTNSSTNATYYSWDFGDGSASTSQNPTHIFTSGGVYNVTLKVRSSSGAESIINKSVSVKNAPTKLKINSVQITSYPLVMSNGSGWDNTDGPDIYLAINGVSGLTEYKSYRKENVLQSDLPLTFSSGLPYTITSFDYQHSIEFYDYDPIGANEYMGGYYFTPRGSMPTNGNKYPTTINFSNSSSQLAFSVTVTWE